MGRQAENRAPRAPAIGAVMQWAVAQGYRADNPAGDAIPAVRVSGAALPNKQTFEFLALTAARSDVVRLAVRAEIDAAAGVWIVPGQSMKVRCEHRVLSTVPATLDEVPTFRDEAAGGPPPPPGRTGRCAAPPPRSAAPASSCRTAGARSG